MLCLIICGAFNKEASLAFAGESTLLKYTIGMEIQEGSVYILIKAFV